MNICDLTEENAYSPGANWSSRDGRRNIVIDRELQSYRGRAFSIRNLSTNRLTNIELSGLLRKFRFVGYDPNYSSKKWE